MISQLTILNLQVVATLLMSYDYFLSEKLKVKFGNQAKRFIETRADVNNAMLNSYVGNLVSMVPIAVSAFVLGLIVFGLYLLLGSIGNTTVLLLLGVVMMIAFVGAFAGFVKVLDEGIFPLTLPLLTKALLSFVLLSSKGVIGAIGFIFLASSFVAQYYNILMP
ncbi:hypothetical protein EAY24_21630 [Vibrio anguillarum]|uniref:hypothetical protein n=1 Tax=Vibrio anguillarum TaxID=55601 RepID=UPI00188A3B23|nr:hypothetical protein [Vibrio anguillarum]MBF4258450.1 hypothetical protein [Vibrio anguillarum]MBF4279557.1 hypothetical protein [Vibrio anguillarum]MBF4295869.1 hypothetical protein [Vibrio anguillarum]MBF4300811.1 hypothetical protein [Vibrio anguillarum]MBF4364206.1 hypothetical protein [Vibrio anguillarum]